MKQAIPAKDDSRADTDREILAVIAEQGRQSLELLRAIISLLLPKEGGREGPTLEELLAAIMAQQRDIIVQGRAIQSELNRLGNAMPAAVADAIEDRWGSLNAPRSR